MFSWELDENIVLFSDEEPLTEHYYEHMQDENAPGENIITKRENLTR